MFTFNSWVLNLGPDHLLSIMINVEYYQKKIKTVYSLVKVIALVLLPTHGVLNLPKLKW